MSGIRSLIVVVLGTLFFVASGCKKKESCVPPEPEVEVDIRVTAADDINGGLPTLVKVFVLKSDYAFARASYKELREDHEAALADDLLGDEKLTIYPESEASLVMSRDENARFIGVTAFFSDPVAERWKDSVHLLQPTQCPSEGGGQPEWGGSVYRIEVAREKISGRGVVKRTNDDSAGKKKRSKPKIPSKLPSAPSAPKSPVDSPPKGPQKPTTGWSTQNASQL